MKRLVFLKDVSELPCKDRCKFVEWLDIDGELYWVFKIIPGRLPDCHCMSVVEKNVIGVLTVE